MITKPDWLKPPTAFDALKDIEKELVKLMNIYEYEDSSTYDALKQVLELTRDRIEVHKPKQEF